MLVVFGAALAAAPRVRGATADNVAFNRDIRGLLSDNCFACHGPDKNKRKADLRLDFATGGAFATHDGKTPIVPGHPEQSELYRRLITADVSELMPPPKSGKHLSPGQVDVLKRWIEQGASWQPLWSFIAPQRPALPEVQDAKWPRNGIDRFILAKLESQHLHPSAEADKATLIRRVTLDLTGVPPTPAEVDAFQADASPGAYEKVVDRLLASPHYGERMALDWLDAARYADTHGYHIDSGRDMTRWREWVIDAYNRDQPFDQFTVEQLAGDLLPNATMQQKIASGFNRNNMLNFEGGAVPEEYETAYCIDRVNTTSTVWLGLTVACAQCHDHKFDAISQKDFYQLYAYFNAVPENGLDGGHGNAEPLLRTPTQPQQQALDEVASKLHDAQAKRDAPMTDVDAQQAQWEQAIGAGSVSWNPAAVDRATAASGATLTREADGSFFAEGANPATESYTLAFHNDGPRAIRALRVEMLADDRLPSKGPGRSPNGNFVMTGVKVASRGAALAIAAVSADFSQQQFPVENLTTPDHRSGWAIYPQAGQPHQLIIELAAPIAADDIAPLELTLEFKSSFSQHQAGRVRLTSTDAQSPYDARQLAPAVRSALAVAAPMRSDAQRGEIRRYYREHVSPTMRSLTEQIAQLEKQKQAIEAKVPTTMVMAQLAKPRDTFILMRGVYDQHGAKVDPATPASLPPLPADAPKNRLALARWLVSPEQPLTARVTVNRLWQSFFGTGIVKTVEDFGSQGEEPSHPALLDWLAVEFREPSDPTRPAALRQPWDVKGMVRLIVTSATYRQSSATSPQAVAFDPEDRLLARSPRIRLMAETVRDQALFAGGLLNDQIGGASVSPYQPAGLWEELMSRSDGANWTAQTYVQSHGPDLYRRTMYTFWKRTSPPPTLSTFDAPDREVCTVKRARTDTPLQALVLMNDPTYVESSRKLAERVMLAEKDEPARISLAFRLVLARLPSQREREVLHNIYQRQLDRFTHDPQAVEKLLKVGEAPMNAQLSTTELAAWTSVASVILNLDEAVTRG